MLRWTGKVTQMDKKKVIQNYDNWEQIACYIRCSEEDLKAENTMYLIRIRVSGEILML
jgi:hypothetical protein